MYSVLPIGYDHPRGHNSSVMKYNISYSKINIRDDTFYRSVDRTVTEALHD